MAEMRTDAATLSAEAASFDRIAGQLQQVMSQVESTGSELTSHMTGAAGTAAQQALARFHEKAQAQTQVLNDIVTNINQAGIQYSKADDEAQSSLGSQMNI
ncbi:MAG: WXG100 family type VII secretion target [Mycobacteriaceae bacterium]